MKPLFLSYAEIQSSYPHLTWTVDELSQLYEFRLVAGIREGGGLKFHRDQVLHLAEMVKDCEQAKALSNPCFQSFFRRLPPEVQVELRTPQGLHRRIEGQSPNKAFELDQQIRITRGLDGNTSGKQLIAIEVQTPMAPGISIIRFGEISPDLIPILFPKPQTDE